MLLISRRSEILKHFIYKRSLVCAVCLIIINLLFVNAVLGVSLEPNNVVQQPVNLLASTEGSEYVISANDELSSVRSATYSENEIVDMTTFLDSNSEFTHRMTAKKFKVDINNQKEKQSIKFIVNDKSDKSVVYRAEQMNSVTGVVDGNTISYNGAWKSTDMIYQVMKDQLKMELHLKDKDAPNTFEFVLITGNVDLRKNSDNSVDFFDKSGELQFKIPRLWVQDSSNEELRYDPLKLEVTQQGKKTLLSITLDDTGLQYPIVIDPTTTLVNYEATIVSHTIPSVMKAGVTYPITITVRNDGILPWSESNEIRLGGVNDSDPFANARQSIQEGIAVNPGQTYTFNFTMTAPTAVGVYTTDWRMLKEGVMWFGAILTTQVTVSNNIPLRDATIISDNIPATMAIGVTYPVSIMVRNDGSSAWSLANMNYLGAVGDQDYFAGGRQPIQSGQTVAPGQTYTFVFNMVAPTTVGSYITDWRMVQDGLEWYGKTLTKTVTVVEKIRNATIVADTIPNSMVAGEKYPVTITVRNDGNLPWNEQGWFRLAVGNDSDPFYAAGRVLIINGETVLPGQAYTFSLLMTAPLTTGSYITDWRMVHDGVTFFGNLFSKTVNVLNANQTTQYKYDNSGRLETVKYHTGHLTEYLYDQNGNSILRRFSANLLDNSSFEYDLTTWILGSDITVSTLKAKTGKKSLRFYSNNSRTATSDLYLNASPNTTYSLSAWMLSNLITGNFYVDWVELDGNNNIIVDGGTLWTASGSNQWDYKLLNFTTSAQTTKLVIRFVVEAANGEAFVDDVQLTKLLSNSSFESNSYGWSLNPTMQISTLKAIEGSKSVRFNSTSVTAATTDSTMIPVTPNTNYKLSAWLLDNMTGGSFYVDWLEFDSRNSLIYDGGTLFSTKRGSGQWDLTSITFTTKPNTTRLIIRIVADSNPKGEAFADQIILEKL